MEKVRYLLALFMAGSEAGAIFGADQLRSGATAAGVAGLVTAVLLLLASVAASAASRQHLQRALAQVRPSPPGLMVALPIVAVATFALGAFAVVDADGSGAGHAVLRAGGGMWMLFLSNLSALASYHLMRDVSRA